MIENQPPEPASRPKLWRYYRERGMTLAEVGAVFGRTPEWVRLVTLAFGDPKRRTPSLEDVARAFEWSGGEITPADWYPPEMSREARPVIERAEAS